MGPEKKLVVGPGTKTLKVKIKTGRFKAIE